MKNRFSWLWKTFFLFLSLVLARMIIRAIILDYFNDYESTITDNLFWPALAFSSYYCFLEIPGFIVYFLLFAVFQILLKKASKLTLWIQVLVSALISLALIIILDMRDFNYLLKVGEVSWREIMRVQEEWGFSSLTYLIFSIIFAVLQFNFIEKKW